jgi:SAM-dependent methyltransferase
MYQTLPFNTHVAAYEEWFEKYPYVFQSEVMAIKDLLPADDHMKGLEVATGTGRFADALGIWDAVEPADNMRLKAISRGINVRDAEAEHLPYHDLSFDFVLMAFCISYFKNLQVALREAHRVIRHNGCLLVGFLDKGSRIGKEYEAKRQSSVFYREANFYTPEKIVDELKKAGFWSFSFRQTLFGDLDEIKAVQWPEPGHGKGSFVVIKALKK